MRNNKRVDNAESCDTHTHESIEATGAITW